MLTNVNQVKGLVIRATDGEIGTVDQLYFDDETWAIRYLTAATGGWLERPGSFDLTIFRRRTWIGSPNDWMWR